MVSQNNFSSMRGKKFNSSNSYEYFLTIKRYENLKKIEKK